jgi:hypothetical protein
MTWAAMETIKVEVKPTPAPWRILARAKKNRWGKMKNIKDPTKQMASPHLRTLVAPSHRLRRVVIRRLNTDEAAKEAKIKPISSLLQPRASKYKDSVGSSMSKPKKIKKFMTMKVTKVRFQRGGLALVKGFSCSNEFWGPTGIMDLRGGADPLGLGPGPRRPDDGYLKLNLGKSSFQKKAKKTNVSKRSLIF